MPTSFGLDQSIHRQDSAELGSSEQASIRWHIAQVYAQVELTIDQKREAIAWSERQLARDDIDWIVAVNAMKTVVPCVKDGSVSATKAAALLGSQRDHESKAVVRYADKLLGEVSEVGC